MPAGRPSDYTEEVAAVICDRLASGESLRKMCVEDETLPCERTVYRWIGQHEDFCQQYAKARKSWADTQVEEILDIADNPEIEPADKRVRIDTRKWAMGKLNGKYSDKTLLGNDPDNPLPATNDTELARLAVFLLSKEAKKD